MIKDGIYKCDCCGRVINEAYHQAEVSRDMYCYDCYQSLVKLSLLKFYTDGYMTADEEDRFVEWNTGERWNLRA